MGNDTSPNQTKVFTGNSTVNFHCVETTKTIYLNSKDLTVFDPVVTNTKHNEMIGVAEMKHREDQRNLLEIQLNETLEAGGNYSLFLAFKGELSQLDGLFVSTYHEGKPAYEGDTNTKR